MKLSTFRFVNVVILFMVLSLESCNDDLSYNTLSNRKVTFNITTQDEWTNVSSRSNGKESHDFNYLMDVYEAECKSASSQIYIHELCSTWNEKREDLNYGLMSRGTPIGRVSDISFAYITGYTDEIEDGNSCPDYMLNEEVEIKNSTFESDRYWPCDKTVSFYAFASNSKIVSPQSLLNTSTSVPKLSYTVPTSPNDQLDLMIAWNKRLSNSSNDGNVDLCFKHALTSVTFKLGKEFIGGHITGLEIKNIYSAGTLSFDIEQVNSCPSQVYTKENPWGGENPWDIDSESRKDYSVYIKSTDSDGISHDKGDETVINSNELTLMMLPQTFTSNDEAVVTVNFTDKFTESQGYFHVLTFKIKGKWEAGKSIVYELSTNPDFIKPELTVRLNGVESSDWSFPYTGCPNVDYDVVSVARIKKLGNTQVETVPLPWLLCDSYSVENIEECLKEYDKNPILNIGEWFKYNNNNRIIEILEEKPDNGTINHTFQQAKDYTINLASNLKHSSNIISGDNIDGFNTANCYIVNAPGKYCLPLIYGNAIKNGYINQDAYVHPANVFCDESISKFHDHLDEEIKTPYIKSQTNCNDPDARLVWQDVNGLIENIKIEGDYLFFEVSSEKIAQGNAIVAVTDSSGIIMWSWHIWVTDYILGQDDVSVTTKDAIDKNMHNFTFMGQNIGWCDGIPLVYPNRTENLCFVQYITESDKHQIIEETIKPIKINKEGGDKGMTGNCVFYQWGRKDPMPGGNYNNGVATDKKTYPIGSFTQIDITNMTVGKAIQNPNAFIIGYNGSWIDGIGQNHCRNSWDSGLNIIDDDDCDFKYYSDVIKTIYDPSPAGYKLPPPCAFNFYEKDHALKWDNESKEIIVKGISGNLKFPITGYRNRQNGKFRISKEESTIPCARYYTSGLASKVRKQGWHFCFTEISESESIKDNINPVLHYQGSYISTAMAIRPIKE